MHVIGINHRLCKWILPCNLGKNIIMAGLPYVGIVYGCNILNALVAREAKGHIMNMVYQLLVITFAMTFLYHILDKAGNAMRDNIRYRIKADISSKAASLDYQDLESQDSMQLLTAALEGEKESGGIYWFSDKLLLDDFILSLRIAMQGYKIAYCDKAYAIESGSMDMHEEQKRKVRIAAGGLQSIARLKELLNLFKYGTLSFQYISHRVLRWSVTPALLFLLFPLNLILVIVQGASLYKIILILQIIFYVLAWLGAIMAQKQIKIKILFIPYYFMFMNLNVLKALFYLKKHKGKGTWEKAKRG